MEDIAEEVGNKGVVAKINVDDNRQAGQRYNIRGIPSLLVLKNGKEVARIRAGSKEQLLQAFRRHL